MATIIGTNGNDTIRTAAAGGSLGGLPNATNQGDTIDGRAGDDIIIGGDGDDTIDGGAGDDHIEAGAGTNQIHTGDGNDTVLSGPGYNVIFPGLGNNHIDGSGGGYDLVVYVFLAAGVTVDLQARTAFKTADGSTDTLIGLEELVATRFVDTLKGSTDNDYLWGDGGDDTLEGREGNDTLEGDTGDDSLGGGAGDDGLVGEAGNDTLDGGEGDDVLIGLDGADIMRGGPGDDRYLVFSATDLVGDVIEELPFEGNDIIELEDFGDGFPTYDLTGLDLADIETVRATRPGAVLLTAGQYLQLGSLTIHTLTLTESGTFDFGAPRDITVINLADGDDVATGSASGAVINGNGGSDLLQGGGAEDHLAGGGGTDTLIGDDGSDELSGGDGDDTLDGGDGNDVLIGGPGADTLRGGPGDDTYRVLLPGDLAGDVFEELPFEGTDAIELDDGLQGLTFDLSGIDLSLFEIIRTRGSAIVRLSPAQYQEANRLDVFGLSLTASGTFDFSTGITAVFIDLADGDDVVTGSPYDATINGNDGNDVLQGNDSSSYLIGSDGDDVLLGGSQFSYMEGGSGDDTLVGGDGFDVMIGGPGADAHFAGDGDDLIVIHAADDLVGDTLDGGEGYDGLLLRAGAVGYDLAGVVISSIEWLEVPFGSTVRMTSAQVNGLVEAVRGDWSPGPTVLNMADAGPVSLAGKGYAFDLINGTDNDDTITASASINGGDGNDRLTGLDIDVTLNGGSGDDILTAGQGFDWLYGEDGNDVLSGGDGYNVLSGGDGDDVLRGGNLLDDLSGDAGDDLLWGGAGEDFISGDSGDDIAQGGEGDDAIDGGEDDDVLLGQGGDDAIVGGQGNDFIDGGAGDDVLDGGDGNDVLRGGDGVNRLAGGAGLDVVFCGADQDVLVLARNFADRDWINGFASGTDRLEVDGALFGLAPGALDPSRLVANANPVATAPGQFLFNTGNGVLRFDADGAGGAPPETLARLIGVSTLGAGDFFIV